MMSLFPTRLRLLPALLLLGLASTLRLAQAQPVPLVDEIARAVAEAGADSPAAAALATAVSASFAEETKLTASDAATDDNFGFSVSLSGARALIGAYADDDGGSRSGSAYVFDLVGGSWSQTAKLTASDAAVDDFFGYSVSLSGDRALVGALWDDDGGFNSGSAYVFDFSGGTWSQTQKLTASDATSNDNFGYSVSLSGDRALIGAHMGDGGSSNSGTAYVFDLVGGVWSQTSELIASDAAGGDNFGYSVSLSGDRALVGAYGNDDSGSQSGSAYVFDLSGGMWGQTQKLTASDGVAFGFFGISVSLSGDRALVGASGDDDGGSQSGSAYVFDLSGGSWSETTKLTASDAAASDQFGISVSLSGDRTLIGSTGDDDGGSLSGSVYVFDLLGGVWSQMQKLTASDAAADDQFGNSVSLSGDRVLVGARLNDDSGSASGSAYVFADLPPSFMITGTEGWRTLALPYEGLPLGGRGPGFLTNMWTAGYVGADRDQRNRRGLANVLLYDEATGTFSPPTQEGGVVPGQGVWVYVHADDDDRTPGEQGGFPKPLSVVGGTPVTGDFHFSVAYTEAPSVRGGAMPGLNLIGNPYDEAIDWDAPSWTKTNVSGTVYLWDPAYEGGSYRAWNGSAGDLPGGVIPAGQGFHIEALSTGPVLIVTEAAKRGEPGVIYGKRVSASHRLVLRLSGTVGGSHRQSEVFVSFEEAASLGFDSKDGRRLAGQPGADALRFYAIVPEVHEGAGDALSILALPDHLDGPIEIPLHAEALAGGTPANEEATLNWEAASLPPGWTASLRDRSTGRVFDLNEKGQITLSLDARDALTHSDADLSPSSKRDALVPPPVPQARPLRNEGRGEARFTLVLTPEASASPAALAAEIGEVGPNPTRGAAALAVTVAEAGEVTVRVYDALGRLVGERRQPLVAGTHRLAVPVSGLAPGAYVVRVEAPGGAATRRLTVVR